MYSYVDLVKRYKQTGATNSMGDDPVHASLAAYPDRTIPLRLCIESLIKQVDSLHVFLNDFNEIPEFLEQEKIFITRSQDFGNLGECGKYYWTDDLTGYYFICSDHFIYPDNYIAKITARIEEWGRKSVIGLGGYILKSPFRNLKDSSDTLFETESVAEDSPVDILNDQALAYHTSTIKVSRHFFYQPWLSAFWFSIVGLQQQIPLICCSHTADWLVPADAPEVKRERNIDSGTYRDFLIKSFFIPPIKHLEARERYDFNSYFDKVWVMNLDRRPDRWKKIKRISKQFNLNLTRFPAIDGFKEPGKSAWERYSKSGITALPQGIDPLADYKDKFLKYNHYPARVHFMETKLGRKALQSPGAWGYALSYIEIIKDAIQKEFRRILIFDDDIVLHHSFNEEFEQHIKILPDDWNLIMLGAMQHFWEPYITLYKDLFYHSHGSSVASHAVGIDRKMLLPLLYYAEKLDLPIDEGAIFHVQNIYPDKCFIFLPNLAIQDLSESDINSSTMARNEQEKWIKLFRWNPEDYLCKSNENSKGEIFNRFIELFMRVMRKREIGNKLFVKK